MVLREATTSTPPVAHCSVPWQMGDVVLPVMPLDSSVAPTESIKGEADGKSMRVTGLVQEGSVRPCAPESPDAVAMVTPRAAALA